MEEKSKSYSKETKIRTTGECQAYLLKHVRDDHNLLSTNNEKNFNCEIEYSNDETLEIKDEILEDHGNSSSRDVRLQDNGKYESEELKVHQAKAKLKFQESNVEEEKKHKCEKCARSYKQKYCLNYHQRFECEVMPQFNCKFCGKLFKHKGYINKHIDRVHQKKNSKEPKTKLNCDNCSQTYTTISSLNRHKRIQHDPMTRHFICDICNYKTKRKDYLVTHITSRHSK
ncbi:zinc finger protein 595-like [Belonocnema kinseyi]|uniref:zinc finger protein 595-like n=1 Tax=Belonocnema kinseyi TaxID=2817044 RepID=UPI00143D61EE|nr:zinc finger protein 595-like [Belonocnema kinseyi]